MAAKSVFAALVLLGGAFAAFPPGGAGAPPRAAAHPSPQAWWNLLEEASRASLAATAPGAPPVVPEVIVPEGVSLGGHVTLFNINVVFTSGVRIEAGALLELYGVELRFWHPPVDGPGGENSFGTVEQLIVEGTLVVDELHALDLPGVDAAPLPNRPTRIVAAAPAVAAAPPPGPDLQALVSDPPFVFLNALAGSGVFLHHFELVHILQARSSGTLVARDGFVRDSLTGFFGVDAATMEIENVTFDGVGTAFEVHGGPGVFRANRVAHGDFGVVAFPADHLRVENNAFRVSRYALSAANASDVWFRSNLVEISMGFGGLPSVRIADGGRALVTDNVHAGEHGSVAFAFENLDRVAFERNDVSGAAGGVLVRSVAAARLADNHVHDLGAPVASGAASETRAGIEIREATADLTRNVVEHNAFVSALVFADAAATVDRCRLVGNGWGALASGPTLLDLSACDVRSNAGGGIDVLGAAAVRLAASNLEGNGAFGLRNQDSSLAVDARGNWWGAATGPNTPGADATIGPVLYDPFLADPNPAAGA